MKSNHYLVIATIALSVAIPQSATAFDFGKLLKQAVEGQNNQPQPSPGRDMSPSTASSMPQAGGKTKSGGIGGALTENYCRNMFSTAGLDKKKNIDSALVQEEFNLSAPGDFYDAFVKGTLKPSFAFPSLRFYQGEFETDRINALYDLLLSYPSPQYAAAIITEARKQQGSPQYDHQMKMDAVAALTILHFYLKDISKNPARWQELAGQLQNAEHYTARVITARLLASGELGVKDPNRAMSYANEANGLRQKYSSEMGYRTMSSRNYMFTSNYTLYQVVAENPRLPQAQYYIQFAQQYATNLKTPIAAPELEAQLGPGLSAVERSASSAARKATDMLTNAREASLLKAEKSSLANATRNRVSDNPSDVNIDDKTMLTITRQLEKLKSLDDKQKQQFASALADAHESGDRAVAMMPTMLSSMMNLMSQRGMAAMPAILPYAKKLQYYSDNACSVVARWDQAAQVTKSTENSSSSLAALVAASE